MKTALFPSLRVKPELRHAAESVLKNGESLSSFVEQSIRDSIRHRPVHQEFIARGLASRNEARLTGKYFPAEDVLRVLNDMLNNAEAKAGECATPRRQGGLASGCMLSCWSVT